jgi:7-keto-8-aminopelargonate synthetase-like enzyme
LIYFYHGYVNKYRWYNRSRAACYSVARMPVVVVVVVAVVDVVRERPMQLVQLQQSSLVKACTSLRFGPSTAPVSPAAEPARQCRLQLVTGSADCVDHCRGEN